MDTDKVKKDAYENGQQFRWDNPDIDCSELSPNGGWTDALLSADDCVNLCLKYEIPTHEVETNGTISEECDDDDQWSEFLDIWESECQRGWKDAAEAFDEIGD
jgi:hypothetical protein